MQLILGFLLALIFFWLLQHVFQAPPEKRKKNLTYLALGIGGVVILLLVVTGRLNFIAALFAALLLLFKRLPSVLQWLPLLRKLFNAGRDSVAGGDGQSSIETSLLRMTLDHRSGKMDGDVLAGRYSGRNLQAMDVSSLATLYRSAVRDYQDSIEILETYFERVYGVHWRTQFSVDDVDNVPTHDEAMTLADAKDVLGLTDHDLSEDEVVEAHRRLMQKFHPDRGGSNYLAAKINEAKRILLAHLRSQGYQ
ncbi:molecular chaperone DnaJ [Hahella sp. NBU794]|uniref:molecular chaperone DnaJ n=1 Tax=Hahella sp. NBU794 TaxID=3422590 RepID=UPI003D6DAC66